MQGWGKGGASLKKARGQLCTVKQPFFPPASEIPPQIPLHLCVKTCISVSKKANLSPHILKQQAWTFRHTDGPESHQSVCCRIKNWDSFFQETSGMFIHLGYFRGDPLERSYLKPRKLIVLKWNALKKCDHNRSPKNVRLDSPAHGSPVGWAAWVGGVFSVASCWLWEHGKGKAAIGAGPRRKSCTVCPRSLFWRYRWTEKASFRAISACILSGSGPGWKSLAPAMELGIFTTLQLQPESEADFRPSEMKTSISSNHNYSSPSH